MYRKKIFALLSATLLVFSCKTDSPPLPRSANFELVPLAERVYACIHKTGGKAICNAGIVDTGKETLIFDTFLSPFVAEELPRIVKNLGLSPVRYVVYSHYHNDHIRGGQVFGPEVKVISTPQTAELIRENEPAAIAAERNYAPVQLARYDSLLQAYEGDTLDRAYQNLLLWQPYFAAMVESHPILETRVPNQFVEDQRIISGPDRELQLIALGQGHTGSDLVLYLPKEKILFTGDLVFAGMHPYLSDGNPDEWKERLGTLQQMEIDKLVPGHGPVSGPESLYNMVAYLESLERIVEKIVIDSIPLAEALPVPIPEPFQDWWFEQFFEWNLAFMFEAKALE